jgi:hypothetical protein
LRLVVTCHYCFRSSPGPRRRRYVQTTEYPGEAARTHAGVHMQATEHAEAQRGGLWLGKRAKRRARTDSKKRRERRIGRETALSRWNPHRRKPRLLSAGRSSTEREGDVQVQGTKGRREGRVGAKRTDGTRLCGGRNKDTTCSSVELRVRPRATDPGSRVKKMKDQRGKLLRRHRLSLFSLDWMGFPGCSPADTL